MPLNIEKSGGDYDPYVKYNTKAGRWYMKGENGEVEISNPVFVADFPNIKTGWLFFKVGSAPERVWDKSLSEPAEKPGGTFVDDKGNTRDCFSRGFSLRCFSPESFKGMAELSSNGMHICNAINDLYVQYEAGLAANANMLPVVSYTGYEEMKDKRGTNFKPQFKIEKWIPRPAEFNADAGQQAAPAQQQEAATPPTAQNSGLSQF